MQSTTSPGWTSISTELGGAKCRLRCSPVSAEEGRPHGRPASPTGVSAAKLQEAHCFPVGRVNIISRLLLYYKRMSFRNSQMEETCGARYVKRGTELLCPLQATVPDLRALTSPEAPRVLSMWHDSDRALPDFLADMFYFPGEISLDQVMLSFKQEVQGSGRTGGRRETFCIVEHLWCSNYSRGHPCG